MRLLCFYLLQVYFIYLILLFVVEEMIGEELERDDVDFFLFCIYNFIKIFSERCEIYVGMDSYQFFLRKEQIGFWEGMMQIVENNNIIILMVYDGVK